MFNRRVPMFASALTGILLASSAVPALAHHSSSAFDIQKDVSVVGRIVEYRFGNPHIYMTLAIANGDGTETEMEVEAGAGSVIRPLGFTRDAVAIGDIVTITGNPGRRNPDGLMLGRELFKANGDYYPLNISSRSNYEPREEAASSLAGTWFSERTEFFSFLQNTNGWKLTPKGSAAKAGTDPLATPQKDCIPLAPPALMFYPVASTITIQDDEVILNVDWMDSKRIVYMDGRSHPDAADRYLLGHSTGSWDGSALLIDTANFAEHPMGLAMNVPGGRGKHLTERLELNDDGKGITYSGVIVDDEYLAEPVRWSGQWVYRPNMGHSNEACDLDVARRFLDD